ncbi:uncharacterized protein ARMOST_08352 [Armillaria ostoyae]|uniref:NodB homology domain-containing protein n=1 Tax=Armillaria ostoyae TaxID=47428 RepID=A0A284R8D0_ARMOS|nr:uncharacterized protein ARMOST_08352 [Armillaria ostoyae]
MRPPFGSYSDTVLQVANAHNQSVIIWDFDSGDSVGVSAAQSNAQYDALAASHPNTILTLNHETYESTATTVLPHAIEVLKRAGYNLVTVAECLGLPPYLSVGKAGTKDNIVFPEITITSFTETGQAESSIKVPLQRSYTGRIPIIPSSLADTPCATLGIPGLLDLFNTTLGTSRTLDTPSLSSVLENCIKNKYDFGTAYGHLRAVWSTDNDGTIRNILRKREADDRKMRQKALVGGRIVQPYLRPRRVWDLCANRVVPWWSSGALLCWVQKESSMSKMTVTSNVRPISHAWMDAKDRVNEQTPINGYKWPVPIPKDANLDLIRIEMLNLGVEYTWLDVLCLRQKGGTKDSEELREEEWMLDVPTIGVVYGENEVAIYLSGLGRPLSLKEGDLESDQCWFRRAWTLQEVGKRRIIAGDMPEGPLHAEPIDEDDTGILTRFNKHLRAIDAIHELSRTLSLSPGMFEVLSEMQNRVSSNPVDKVAGLTIPLMSTMIPAYHESESLEDAWTALVNTMSVENRSELFFWYPEPGDARHKWRPSWDQVMSKALPANEISNMVVCRDHETDVDWYQGPCIGKGFVRGLAVGGAEKDIRRGELIVKRAFGRKHRRKHTFNIIARHGYPIPEDTYTLLGMEAISTLVLLGPPLHYCPLVRTQYWVIGRRLLDEKFEKVSVFEMADREEVLRLNALGITEKHRNILI